MNNKEFENELIKADIAFHKDISLKDYTTIKIGGKAQYLVEIGHVEEIIMIIDKANKYNIPHMIMGNGSNILFMDEGYKGIVVVLGRQFSKISHNGFLVEVQAGALLKDVCEYVYQHSLSGLEFAYGIPGSIGGAVYMNAGAYGGEIKNVIKAVSYLDENGKLITQEMMADDFSYRKSPFTDRNVSIVKVTLKLSYGTKANIQAIMDDNMNKRILKQPLEYPSAGSVFKRPIGNYASALIEECGLKGLQVGGAMVSKKHAGFLINYHQSTSKDFITLMNKVKEEVKSQKGYDLEYEIKIIK